MSNLWAVNSLGKVYTLSTAENTWLELESYDLDFKRVSAHEFFTWAIGGDHQIYIYVPTRDIPIRYRVTTYQNERWNPVNGFSEKLLPTDRPHWSSADGLVSLPKENFQLPSKGWEWEGDWYVEDNLEGQPLEPEGWTYAVDFPARYGPNKTWNSLVRRRKWIRYRRFCATNKWSLIPSIHEDPVLEPFIDVTVGGTEVPGGESKKFSVWAVTVMGRIVFRYGVSETSPEGSGWVPVDTPEKCEVSQVSVGPTGLVWAVTWGGCALVRIEVTRENMMGSYWIIVDSPNPEDGLTQVSVGKYSVWALSKDNKVWFRKGIDGLHSFQNKDSAIGSGWSVMFGNLANLSVGIGDQVFSVSVDGHDVLLRTGISSMELGGRTWRVIEAPIGNLHHALSLSSLDSMSNVSQRGISDSVSIGDSSSVGSHTQSFRKVSHCSVSSTCSSEKNPCHEIETGDASADESGKDRSDTSGDMQNVFFKDDRTASSCSVDSGAFNDEIASMVWQSPMEGIMDNVPIDGIWIWISASGCLVDSDSLPNWFSLGNLVNKSAVDEPWYDDVLSQFKNRFTREMLSFSSYPKAIEKTSWVKSVTCRWYKYNWMKCLLELIQHEDGSSKSTLTVHYGRDMVVIQLNHITCAICLPDWNKNVLAVYTAKRATKGSPYKFSFTSNDDLEDWLASLNTSCCIVNKISRVPDKKALWAVTVNGDVYVCNSVESEHVINMKWNLLGGGHLRIVETCPAGIAWGLGYNCITWTYTKGYGGGPYHGVPGSNSAVGPMSDVRCLYIYENQRWNPLSGFTAKGLPTDRYMWSDSTGRIECTKENTHLPSCHWQWISDWCIDYKTPGGVDNEGWQYATDFPRSYHGYKRFTDYVRRRRWYRKCKLTTSGPWKKMNTSPLRDISFQIDATEEIGLWAVAANGDVLYRVGVTEHCPRGTSWVHVPTEKSFCSISVGGDGSVWAVAEDGSAHLRHGVSSRSPTGEYWCHVEPPQVGCPLRQISAGKSIVLAVDESHRLWSRQEIVPIFKEGTHWKLVSEDVIQVSVGPMNQIWCIKSNVTTPSGVISGVICHRIGISEDNPYGSDWEQGIGGCWNYITARGCLFNAQG